MKKKIRLLGIILFSILLLIGCSVNEVERKTVIDVRFTPFHEEEKIGYKKEYSWFAEEWYDVPYTYKEYVPEKYELMWEYTYMNGWVTRCWEDCTRKEYEDAKLELGYK